MSLAALQHRRRTRSRRDVKFSYMPHKPGRRAATRFCSPQEQRRAQTSISLRLPDLIYAQDLRRRQRGHRLLQQICVAGLHSRDITDFSALPRRRFSFLAARCRRRDYNGERWGHLLTYVSFAGGTRPAASHFLVSAYRAFCGHKYAHGRLIGSRAVMAVSLGFTAAISAALIKRAVDIYAQSHYRLILFIWLAIFIARLPISNAS